jgi:hypothetical protein
VAAHRRRVAYYAGARYHPLPSRFGDGVVEALRARGVRYVILEEEREEILLRDAPAPGLRPIHESRAGGHVARIYELVSPSPLPPTP